MAKMTLILESEQLQIFSLSEGTENSGRMGCGSHTSCGFLFTGINHFLMMNR